MFRRRRPPTLRFTRTMSAARRDVTLALPRGQNRIGDGLVHWGAAGRRTDLLYVKNIRSLLSHWSMIDDLRSKKQNSAITGRYGGTRGGPKRAARRCENLSLLSLLTHKINTSSLSTIHEIHKHINILAKTSV